MQINKNKNVNVNTYGVKRTNLNEVNLLMRQIL